MTIMRQMEREIIISALIWVLATMDKGKTPKDDMARKAVLARISKLEAMDGKG